MKKLLFTFFILCLSFSISLAEEIDVFKLAEKGTPKQLKEALNHGAKFNVTRNVSEFNDFPEIEDDYWPFDHGETPLHRAATYNHHPGSIKFLLKQGLDIEATASVGNSASLSPLACALWNKNIVAVKELLKNGANPNAWIVGDYYFIGTPLHIVAFIYDDTSSVKVKNVVNLLVKSGADVDSHEVLSQEAIEELKEYEPEFAEHKTIFLPREQWDGNNPCSNIRSFSHAGAGELIVTLTPLMWAVLCDNVNVVDALLNFRPDVNIRSVENKSAIDYANELPANSRLKKSSVFEKLKLAITNSKNSSYNQK